MRVLTVIKNYWHKTDQATLVLIISISYHYHHHHSPSQILFSFFRCSLSRNVSFMGCYQVSSNLVVNYLQPIKQNVESLNLNYCYWLAPGCCDTIVRCTNLVSLHLLHINISVKRLVGLLAALKKLQRVSVTIKNVREFQTLLDKTPRAQETMRGVRVLTIQVKNQPVQAQMMTMHFLAVTSFFEYCPSLEEFHVQGLFCTKGIPPYVVNPQVSVEHP